jgi:hypothetical protein
MMRFDNDQHRFYAGIDLHARFMHVCVLDAAGNGVYDHIRLRGLPPRTTGAGSRRESLSPHGGPDPDDPQKTIAPRQARRL